MIDRQKDMTRFSPPAGITAVKIVNWKGKTKESPSNFCLKGVSPLSLRQLRLVKVEAFKKNADCNLYT